MLDSVSGLVAPEMQLAETEGHIDGSSESKAHFKCDVTGVVHGNGADEPGLVDGRYEEGERDAGADECGGAERQAASVVPCGAIDEGWVAPADHDPLKHDGRNV